MNDLIHGPLQSGGGGGAEQGNAAKERERERERERETYMHVCVCNLTLALLMHAGHANTKSFEWLKLMLYQRSAYDSTGEPWE